MRILHTCIMYIYSSVFEHMDRVASTVAERGLDFKLREGYSAETSGENPLPDLSVTCVL